MLLLVEALLLFFEAHGEYSVTPSSLLDITPPMVHLLEEDDDFFAVHLLNCESRAVPCLEAPRHVELLSIRLT